MRIAKARSESRSDRKLLAINIQTSSPSSGRQRISGGRWGLQPAMAQNSSLATQLIFDSVSVSALYSISDIRKPALTFPMPSRVRS